MYFKKVFGRVYDIFGADFTTQVRMMFRSEIAALYLFCNRIGNPNCACTAAVAVFSIGTNPKAIENCCNASCSYLCVIGYNCRCRVPIDLRPWLNVDFQVIGMKLDKPWNQHVTLKRDAILWSTPLSDFDNFAVNGREPTVFDDAVG